MAIEGCAEHSPSIGSQSASIERGGPGLGGTSSNSAGGQLQREPAVSPSYCLGASVLVLATLSCQFVLLAHLNSH